MKTRNQNILPLALALAALGLNPSLVQPAEAAPWVTNGPLATARNGHTATLLPNGKVLVAGGWDNSAELYDPVVGTWTVTGSRNNLRSEHTATLLPSGKVLVVGGLTTGFNSPSVSSELYETASGTWTPTSPLANAQSTDSGKYSVVVSNQAGSILSSNAILLVNPTQATPVFTRVNAAFVGVRSGAMAWGDYDNDGYLDLIVTGDAGNATTVLYHNNGDGTFTAMPFNFAGYRSSSVAWGDFDNDGYLDLLVTGLTGDFSARIYRNLGGTNFTEFMLFPAVYDGQVKWGDIDNDGWLDFAITGAGPFSQIYHNLGGTNFVLLGSGLTQLYYGSVDWADFDHDGNLDLLLTGMSTSPQQNPDGSYLYRNDGNGHFTSTWFLRSFSEAGQWLDFDNDGWPDLALQSWSSGGLRLYRNNHAGGFDLAVSLPMWLLSVGDFNNDGWSDLLIGNQILQNSGIGLWPAVSTSLPSFIESAACGDFNNDGKLDLVVWGQSANGYLTYLYRNDVAATNLPPTPPGGLCALATGTNVVLSWDTASDDHQTGGLTYNLRVGTTPGGCDVVSPMSAPNGFRRVVRSGNTGGLTHFTLCGLRAAALYYWSVQAIDNSFVGSAFAAEKSFVATVLPTISGFTNITVLRDSGPLAIPFIVGDLETPAGNLVIAATSSNVQLVAPTDLVISGTDGNRTLEITPEASQTGTAIITVTVTDGDGGQTSQAFHYTVVAACVPTPTGLVSWWRWEGSPLDSAGTNDGSGPVAYQAGEVGSAFYEDGSSWVSISPSPSLDVGAGSGFTFEAWINPADLTGPGYKTIVAYVVPGFGPGVLFAVTSNTDSHGAGALYAALNSADLHNAELFSAGGILTTGAYQHVAFTYDKASGMLMIFCNGVVVAQDAVGPIAPNTGGAIVTLGGSSYLGLLDELSVYSRALSTLEIRSIYNAGSAGKCVSGSPPEITTQPQSQFAWTGAKATFSVTASSTSTLSYQWRKSGTDIAGATTSEYTISSVQPNDAGLYAVLVGNRAGAVLSSNAVLTLQVPGRPPFTSTVIVGWGDPTWGAPTAPAGLTNVLAIAAGGYHSLALTLDGKVVGFGNNYYGQSSGPTAASNVVAIAAGWLNSFVVKSDGTVAGWGDDFYHQTAPPPGLSNVVAVAAGGYTWGHTLALKRDGTVVAWGTNSSGEIDVPAGLSNVIAIAAGDTSSLALKSDGPVVGWGTANVPAGLSNVIAIACGAQHSLALKGDGTVVAWGSPNLTLGTEVPAGLSNVVGIAAGTFHSLALKSDGTVVGWGWNDYSQTRVPAGLSNVVALAAGELHSIALVNNGAPWLLWQPRPQATFIGLSADFSVVAIGAQPLSYQWQLKGTNIDGATTAHLVLTNVQSSDAGSYSVVVGNAYGSVTSSNAALGVSASSPILLTQPADQSVLVGSNVVFGVSAAGTPSLSYQWQFNGADISGETNTVLLLPDAPASASGRYSVVVSNTLGRLTSREAILNVYDVPQIISQPTNQTVVVGARAIFATLAQSLPPLDYQWQFNGTNIPGATNSVFTIDAVQFSDSGVYQALLNNPLSNTSSFPAVLKVVDGAPVIVTPPVSQETYLGGAATFSVIAGGSPPLAYQWQFEGTNIADGTNSLLAFSQVAYGQAGRYSV